jgi:peptidyl-tRNA hydrolase, PTH1 family
MLILVGLGNPEAKYAHNRHNLGFLTLGAIAKRWNVGPERAKFNARVAEGAVDTAKGRVPILLLKPQTYYNDSGLAVSQAVKFYKAQPGDVVVFHDEIDLAPGRFRMRTGGGAAGNNGIRSITAAIGPDFRRARMGMGHPGHKDLVMNYVLSDIPKADHDWVNAMANAAADALPFLAMGEDEKYQAEVMRLAPAEKADPRATPSP